MLNILFHWIVWFVLSPFAISTRIYFVSKNFCFCILCFSSLFYFVIHLPICTYLLGSHPTCVCGTLFCVRTSSMLYFYASISEKISLNSFMEFEHFFKNSSIFHTEQNHGKVARKTFFYCIDFMVMHYRCVCKTCSVFVSNQNAMKIKMFFSFSNIWRIWFFRRPSKIPSKIASVGRSQNG